MSGLKRFNKNKGLCQLGGGGGGGGGGGRLTLVRSIFSVRWRRGKTRQTSKSVGRCGARARAAGRAPTMIRVRARARNGSSRGSATATDRWTPGERATAVCPRSRRCGRYRDQRNDTIFRTTLCNIH